MLHKCSSNFIEFRGDLWRQKTRVPGLSCGFLCVILRLAVLVEHRLVTDTARQRVIAYTALPQSRAVMNWYVEQSVKFISLCNIGQHVHLQKMDVDQG